MIEIKTVRRAPAYHRCPVCRAALATNGANVRVTIDAENEATAVEAFTHKACAKTVIDFTRERGYTPAELVEVGVWAEQQLRLLGNGVVPQQGAAAIYQLTRIAIKEAV